MSEYIYMAARDALEMTVAMMLGMCILGAAFGEIHLIVFGAGFDDVAASGRTRIARDGLQHEPADGRLD